MEIKHHGNPNPQLVEWNNRMYREHPTPYTGAAGVLERARVRTVLSLAEVSPDDAVLEVGCESGHLLASIPEARRIVGLDLSRTALEDAVRLLKSRSNEVQFFQLDAQSALPFLRGEFDVILCSELLEHTENPRAVLENIHDLCGEQTRVVISVPIEATKVLIKNFLVATGLLKMVLPGIESKQSEWHLHAFSKERLWESSRGLFRIEQDRTVWAIHYVALMTKA
ncbi:MAG: class I SAM-dependent methyltransferase [Planctomycetota bacterium]|jgi:2-polyprenyl-3-methyl-5-hydroxy-6-metoxy-1,4-benzoquinol methylase